MLRLFIRVWKLIMQCVLLGAISGDGALMGSASWLLCPSLQRGKWCLGSWWRSLRRNQSICLLLCLSWRLLGSYRLRPLWCGRFRWRSPNTEQLEVYSCLCLSRALRCQTFNRSLPYHFSTRGVVLEIISMSKCLLNIFPLYCLERPGIQLWEVEGDILSPP